MVENYNLHSEVSAALFYLYGYIFVSQRFSGKTVLTLTDAIWTARDLYQLQLKDYALGDKNNH